MRASDAAERRLAHRIERRPEADRLRTLDRIVRLVRVPWRRPLRPRLLDQHVLVEELRHIRLHELSRDRGYVSVASNLGKFRYTGPVDVVLEESASLTRPRVLSCKRPRLGHVSGDARPQQLDVARRKEAAAQTRAL